MKKKAIKALALTLAGLAAGAGVTGGVVAAVKKSNENKGNTPINQHENGNQDSPIDTNEPVVTVSTVTFELGNEVETDIEIDNQTIPVGGKAECPTELVAERVIDGYMFDGWDYEDENGDKQAFDFDTPITEDMTLFAHWTKLHTVTFNNNGVETPITVRDHEAVTPATPDEREGYTFGGWWYVSNNTEIQYQTGDEVTSDMTLHAKWNAIPVTVTFDTNTTQVSVASQTVDYGHGMTLPTPSWQNHTFAGWYENTNFSGTRYNGGSTFTTTTDKTLYAKWTVTVTFKTKNSFNDSTPYSDYATRNDILWNTALGAGNMPANHTSRDGYDFTGWFTDESCTTQFTAETPIEQDKTVYAGYEIRKFTVTFDLGEGATIDGSTTLENVEYNLTISEPTNLNRTGYRFTGWTYSVGGDEKGTFNFNSTKITDDTVIKANWVQTHTVTFVTNGGSTIDPITVDHGKKINKPTTTRADCTLGGWYTDPNFENSFAFGDSSPYQSTELINADITLYAKWTAQVVFMTKNGTSNLWTSTERTVVVNTAFDDIEFTVPDRTGHTFNGKWYTDSSYSQEFNATQQITQRTLIYAGYDINHYTVTFNIGDGATMTGNSEVSVAYNSPVSKPADPTRDDYIFKGWYDNADCTGSEFNFNTSITGPKTIYAKWLAIYEYEANDDGYTLKKYNGSESNVEIPAEYDEEPVTAIGANAFRSNGNLTSITIPASVTSIGDGVTSYWDGSFYNCSNLDDLNYTGTLEQWLQIEFGNQFSNPIFWTHKLVINDEEITTLEIPNSITKINAYAFSNCKSLTSVVIPNTVTEIGENAFAGCSCLTSIIIPESVNTMGYGIFDNCELNIYCETESQPEGWDEGWKYWECEVFWGKNQQWKIENGEPTYTIGTLEGDQYFNIEDGVLRGLSYQGAAYIERYARVNVVIPNTVTAIYGYNDGCCGFTDCSAFYVWDDSFEWEDGHTGNYHDYGDKVISVTLPSGLTTIGEYAFFACRNLTSINVPATVIIIGCDAFSTWTNTTITFAEGSQLQYVGSNGDVIFPDDVQHIEHPYGTDGQFIYAASSDISSASDLYIVKYIGNGGEVVIPENFNGYDIQYIDSDVFVNFNNITAIYCDMDEYEYDWIPEGVQVYWQGEWEKSNGNFVPLKDSEFRYSHADNDSWSVTQYLGNSAEVEIPESFNGKTVIGIDDEAFYDYSDQVTSITIPETVTEIGNYAFHYCTGINSIVIPSSVTYIGYDAFCAWGEGQNIYCNCSESYAEENWDSDWREDCEAHVYFQGEWTYDHEGNPIPVLAGEKYFEIDGDGVLTGLSYEGVKYIENHGDVMVVIPDGVTEIRGHMETDSDPFSVSAFSRGSDDKGCSVTAVVLPESLTRIGDYAFDDCYNLSWIKYSENVQISDCAFTGCYNYDVEHY